MTAAALDAFQALGHGCYLSLYGDVPADSPGCLPDLAVSVLD